MSDDRRQIEQAKRILALLGEVVRLDQDNKRLTQAIALAPHDWKHCEIGDTDIDDADDGTCHCWKRWTGVEDEGTA